MRKDAEANRGKLVLAGRRLMQEEGGDVPVERICELAGVTRGTFYRNFEDRAALYEAVLEHELAVMAFALEKVEDEPLAFLQLFAEMMMLYDKFLAVLPDMDDYRDDGVSEAKIVAVIEPPMRRAQSKGLIRKNLTGDDIMLACRMIACDWRLDRQSSREAAIKRRVDLIMSGLAAEQYR